MDYATFFSPKNAKLSQATFCRKDDKLSTQIDMETIILDMVDGVYSQLNPVASLIWELLQEDVTLAQLITKVTDRFDTTDEECTPDILSFLQQLADKEFITIQAQ